jgi:hypothetical protein
VTAARSPASHHDRPSARFRDLDEAALFDERAAIRQHDSGLGRDAAERLAWLDVLAARQVAAGALAALAPSAQDFQAATVARNQSGKMAAKEL